MYNWIYTTLSEFQMADMATICPSSAVTFMELALEQVIEFFPLQPITSIHDPKYITKCRDIFDAYIS